MKSYLVVCCLFVGVACGSQSFGAEPNEEKMVIKTYAVGDLIVPALNGSIDQKVAHTLNLISQNVKPNTWATKGGKGTVDYFPLGLTIVVNQTVEGHKELEKYIKELRKNTEAEEKVKEEAEKAKKK